MADKLTDIFQVSRMMLPEHKARISQQYRELKNPKRERPVLDPQEWEIINEAMSRSLHLKESIRLRMFDEYEELIVEGIVERVDMSLKQVKVEGEWFKLRDITGVDNNLRDIHI